VRRLRRSGPARERSELASRTFCIFPREFSSLRRPELLSGTSPARWTKFWRLLMRRAVPVSPGLVSGSTIQRSGFLVDNLSKDRGSLSLLAAELARGESQRSLRSNRSGAVTTTRAEKCRMSVQTAGLRIWVRGRPPLTMRSLSGFPSTYSIVRKSTPSPSSTE